MVRKLKFHEQKLIKKVNFIAWKADCNLKEVKTMKKYYIQDRGDYVKYAKLARDIRSAANKLKGLASNSKFRIEMTAEFLEKLYYFGLIPGRWDLNLALNVSASSFCKRRLPAIVVKNNMAANLKEATEIVEQGQVKVGGKVMKNPAFIVSRSKEDSVNWVDSPAIEGEGQDFNEVMDDVDMH